MSAAVKSLFAVILKVALPSSSVFKVEPFVIENLPCISAGKAKDTD